MSSSKGNVETSGSNIFVGTGLTVLHTINQTIKNQIPYISLNPGLLSSTSNFTNSFSFTQSFGIPGGATIDPNDPTSYYRYNVEDSAFYNGNPPTDKIFDYKDTDEPFLIERGDEIKISYQAFKDDKLRTFTPTFEVTNVPNNGFDNPGFCKLEIVESGGAGPEKIFNTDPVNLRHGEYNIIMVGEKTGIPLQVGIKVVVVVDPGTGGATPFQFNLGATRVFYSPNSPLNANGFDEDDTFIIPSASLGSQGNGDPSNVIIRSIKGTPDPVTSFNLEGELKTIPNIIQTELSDQSSTVTFDGKQYVPRRSTRKNMIYASAEKFVTNSGISSANFYWKASTNCFDKIEVFPNPQELDPPIPSGSINNVQITKRVNADDRVIVFQTPPQGSKGIKTLSGPGFLIPKDLTNTQKINVESLVSLLRSKNTFKDENLNQDERSTS